jgi:ribosomal-protein-alanine N-acetyltransferase
MRIETKRLVIQPMTMDDYEGLKKILQDREVMYAYEHAFSDQEVQDWYDNQQKRYQRDGFGLWAVKKKETGEMIGQCGITWQDFAGKQVLEVGYLFQKAYWHMGYATESAKACKEYAFLMLGAEEVYSIIRDNNFPSQNVARRNGMKPVGTFVKHYWGIDMPHIAFCITKQAFEAEEKQEM